MKRILHIITGLGQGGAEKVLSTVVVKTQGERVEHRVVSLRGLGYYGPVLQAQNITVGNCLSLIGWRCQGWRPDIVQTWLYHADVFGAFITRIISLWRPRPHLIWTVRCADMDLSAYAWLARLGLALAKKLSWAADEFITNSYAGQRVHQDYGYAQRPWSVITNGVDTTVFHPCLTPKALNNRRIICVARWDPMKDHATLLAAMQQVWVHCPDVILTLVGPGMVPENQALQAIIPKDRPVELLGSQQNMAEILHTADIAVLASKTEGLPNVLLEAMACAVPCAATAVGDVAHLLADGGGVIVPPQNPVQLAHAILQLLALPAVDRQAMGQQGRHTIEQRYSLEKMLQSYLQIWLR